MLTDELLEHCVNEAIRKERCRVKKIRRSHPDKQHRITDYAAIVVACGYVKSNVVFLGKSSSPINYRYDNRIRERLLQLGNIGEKGWLCNNIIGACAEPHAADKVLKEFPGCNMGKLKFSAAYRPRTAKKKRYCHNCKNTFYEVL